MRAGTLIILGFLLLACGGRSSVGTSTTYEDGFEPTGERRSSAKTDVELFSGSPEGQLRYGNKLAREGQFGEALQIFRRLYENRSTKERVREEALLRMAETEGGLLNPQRDYAKAIEHLERFLEEFPRSELLSQAEDTLSSYRGILEEL